MRFTTDWIKFRFSGYFLFYIFFALFATVSCGRHHSEALGGLLDCRDWNFKRNGAIPLIGQWEFQWLKFSESDSFLRDGNVKIPGTWNQLQIQSQRIGGIGYGTLRLRIKLPSSGRYYLYAPPQVAAFNFYVNGRSISPTRNAGVRAEESLPVWQADVLDAGYLEKEAEILIHVSNFHHQRGDMNRRIYLGNVQSISEVAQKRSNFDMFLIGAYLITFFVTFIFWFTNKSRMNYLTLPIVDLVILGRILSTGDRPVLNQLNLSTQTILKLEYLFLIWLAPLFFNLIMVFLRGLKVRKQFWFLYGVAIGFSLVILFSKPLFFSRFVGAIIGLNILSQLMALWVLIIYFRVSRSDVRIVFVGFLFTLSTTVIEIIQYYYRLMPDVSWAPVGGLALSVALLFVIAIRLNHRKTQALNLAAGLIRINQHIGEMIQERTEELAHTNMRLRELLYIVAHELKAPISGIALTVSGLLNQKKQNPEKLGQSFRSILKTAENMLLLVRNFLTTDDSQELVLANSPMLVQEIVQSAAVNLQLFAKAHNVFLRVKPMKINILMDRPDYLRQILENLIGNAIKHSSKTKKPLVEIGVNSNEN